MPFLPAEPMTTSAVARALNLCETTVRHLERRGVLHAVRTSTRMRIFDSDDVRRLVDARRERPAEPETDCF